MARHSWVLVLVMIAMLSMGAAASPTPASAKLIVCTEKFFPFWEFETLLTCWAGKPEVIFGIWKREVFGKGQTASIASSGGPFILSATIAGRSVEIKCEKETDSTELVGGEPIAGTVSMEFTSCGAEPCQVEGPIKIEAAKVEVVAAGGKFFYKISPSFGTTLATFTLRECPCAGNGSYELKGTARSEIGSETSSFDSGTGSELKLENAEGSGAATLTGEVAETMAPSEEETAAVRFQFEE